MLIKETKLFYRFLWSVMYQGKTQHESELHMYSSCHSFQDD